MQDGTLVQEDVGAPLSAKHVAVPDPRKPGLHRTSCVIVAVLTTDAVSLLATVKAGHGASDRHQAEEMRIRKNVFDSQTESDVLL